MLLLRKEYCTNMRRSYFLFLLFFINIFIFCGCSNSNSTSNNADYTANRTSTSVPNDNNTQNNKNPAPPVENNAVPAENTEQPENANSQNETVASEFSTKIKTKSSNRANNIEITCSKLNGVIVNSGEEFSFCKTTGVSKASEGYKKADVIVGDSKIKALGGGNCQVSTTLFNAVLNCPDLEVTERHPHGKKVNYVPEGKDAAIAHGSKDFKFKNNSSKKLKIYASSDNSNVSIKLTFID